MLNKDLFIKRLHKILEHYRVSAATFADVIDVQRSSISHILSGRNKPSLEFVLKIVDAYDEVSLDWLVYGNSTFPAVKKEIQNVSSSDQKEFTFKNESTSTPPKNDTKKTTSPEIEKIVVFYKNGTFKQYLQ